MKMEFVCVLEKSNCAGARLFFYTKKRKKQEKYEKFQKRGCVHVHTML